MTDGIKWFVAFIALASCPHLPPSPALAFLSFIVSSAQDFLSKTSGFNPSVAVPPASYARREDSKEPRLSASQCAHLVNPKAQATLLAAVESPIIKPIKLPFELGSFKRPFLLLVQYGHLSHAQKSTNFFPSVAEGCRRIKLPNGDRIRKVQVNCDVTPQTALRIERNATVSPGFSTLSRTGGRPSSSYYFVGAQVTVSSTSTLTRAVDRTVYGDGRTFDGRILVYPYRIPSRRHKFQELDGTVRHKNGRIREDGT
ncbi:hypothetical protein B0H13DRAFT_2340167 [Mycena leptocephala]|nr:hypothetical protein B0H13DRAFT_2340167 [Mycena leptocephala]